MKGNYRVIFGLLLILAGILLGMQQFGYLPGDFGDVFGTLAFGLGLVFFFTIFMSDRSQWWAALLSFIFLGLTLTSAVDLFLPQISDISGSVFLLMIGLGFLFVYFRDRINWWAIIPGGVMLSLTAVTLAEDVFHLRGIESGGFLFLGLGLTFLALTFIHIEGQSLDWAIWPALGLLVFGFFITFEQAYVWNYIWPLFIIILGVYFLMGSFRRSS